MTPRPLRAATARRLVAEGSRWAWELEPRLAATYRASITAAYDGAATALEARALTAAGPQRDPGWSKPDEDELGDALRRKYEERTDAASTAIRVEAMRRVTKAGLERMNVSLEVINPLLEGVLEQLGGNIEINDTTRREIMRSLDESWREGDSIPRAAKKLRADGRALSKTRSVLIARTELIGAINAAAHALAQISNENSPPGAPVLLKTWLTAEDERVRTTHVKAGKDYGNGGGIPLGEPFQVGESAMMFPGDQNGSADEVCNCRCALSYEEGALVASTGASMEDVEFKGRTYRPTGELTASGVPVYTLAVEEAEEAPLPAEANGAAPVGDLLEEPAIESAGGRAWTAVLTLEGVSTSDGRMFGLDSWRWRSLPLTLAMQFELQPEHLAAVPVGRIDAIEKMPVAAAIAAGLMDERDDGYEADAIAVVGRGIFDDSPMGDEAMRLVGDQVQRGVSADYAPEVVEVLEMPPGEGEEMGRLIEICTASEMLGATIVSQPAFAGTTIILDAMTAGGARPRACTVMKTIIRLARVEPTLTAAAIDYSSHSMIAVHPTAEQAQALAQEGGQPAGDLHVTLAYLPNPEGVDFDALRAIVGDVASQHATITGRIGGAGYFAPAKSPDAEPEDEIEDESKATLAAESVEGPAADPEDEEVEDDGAPDHDSLHPHVALVDAPGLGRMRHALCSALDDAGIEYAQNHDFTPHVTLGYEATPGQPAMRCAGQECTFSHLSVHEGQARSDHPMSDAGESEPEAGLTASAAGIAPDVPPAEWFEAPELDEPTPLTITDDGRIYGHLATWGTCHTAFSESCVQPPSSETDYSLFHLGHVQTSEGDLVPVGTLTMDTGHAHLRDAGRPVGARAALAHYDHTGTAVADVRVGEDEHGIWFAGAIRPELEARQVRRLRAAKVSGDWRPHNGNRELIAALCVNAPGFPVVRPRTAITASGEMLGLVAAGVDLRPPTEEVAVARLRVLARFDDGLLERTRTDALARLS